MAVHERLIVDGKPYKLCLLRVSLRDEAGRPIQADIIEDRDSHVELSEDARKNCFILGYVGLDGLNAPEP